MIGFYQKQVGLQAKNNHISLEPIAHPIQSPLPSQLACPATIAMPDQPTMSPASKELFTKLRMIVPPMLEKFHKGAFPRLASNARAVNPGYESYKGTSPANEIHLQGN